MYSEYRCLDLTPVEQYGEMLYKRDDLYIPFQDIDICGGKARQALSLIGGNKEYIHSECGGHVVIGTAMSSPMSVIVTRVSNEFGFDTTLFVGNTNPRSLLRNGLIVQAMKLGAKVNMDSVQAFDANLNREIQRARERGHTFFQVRFGSNWREYPEAILDSIGYQVQNLPDDLDYLIIPCGSCLNVSGILRGLIKYGKKPKKVLGIQIAGYDRTDVIKEILGDDLSKVDFELLVSTDYSYQKWVNHEILGIGRLDFLYEAKAYDYLIKYRPDILKKNSLFWLVGNACSLREKKFTFRDSKMR